MNGCWREKDEELIRDITCWAMPFLLLRTKGYEVSSDELAEFVDQDHFFNKVSRQHNIVTTVFELYRASQFIIHEKDDTLEKINAWTSVFLKQQLLNQTILDKRLQKQVERELKNFNGLLDRVEHRRYIELYDSQDFQILKTAYRSSTIHNEDFLQLSAQDFKFSQAQYLREFYQIERWSTECRLEQLSELRDVTRLSYNVAAAIFAGRESSEARIVFTQLILFTYIDDFFDDYGPREEALSIFELVSKWKMEETYCSREVEILFTAIYKTMNETAAKASPEQGRCVKHEVFDQYLRMVTAFTRSMDSKSKNGVSSMDDYFSYALTSNGLEICIVLPGYFVGIKVPEGITKCEEFDSLRYHSASVCRLLNDIKSFKREENIEKSPANSMTLLAAEGAITEEETISKIKEMIEHNRRKVLQMLYQTKGSVIPRKYKDIFWKTTQIAYFLYPFDGGDEYNDPHEIIEDLNACLWDPLHLCTRIKYRV